jgi:ankyrin repeat protein
MKIKTLLVCALFIVSLRSFGKGGTNQVIFAAAEQGDVPLLQQIFATNLDAYALRDDLLRTAAIDGQKDAVDFLIDKGADPNAKVFSTGLLSTMAMYGTPDDDKHVEVATLLLARGAQVDPVDQSGATPLFNAAEANKIKFARLLLEHGANPAVTRNGTYYSPLLIAVRSQHLDMAKLLLDFKAPTDIKDPNGNMPMLVWAIRTRNHELARLLVEHGATLTPPRSMPPGNVETMGQRQYLQWTYNQNNVPMLAAIQMHDTELLSLMLQSNAPVDAIDAEGNTALHWAVQSGGTNAVRLLLDAKARVDVTNYEGATPLFLAEERENKAMADMLRQAATARGVTVEEIVIPSSEDMRAVAKRICDGDPAAFDDLMAKAADLYRNDDRRNQARRRLNAGRMGAAFDVLGGEAGKGNSNAFQTLKSCLEGGKLRGWAPNALGIAAAAGSDESLKLLLRYREWHLLESDAAFALAAPAKANKEPAVDFFVSLALDPQSAKHEYYGVGWLVKEVLQTSVTNGNPKAKDTLDKFLAASKL